MPRLVFLLLLLVLFVHSEITQETKRKGKGLFIQTCKDMNRTHDDHFHFCFSQFKEGERGIQHRR